MITDFWSVMLCSQICNNLSAAPDVLIFIVEEFSLNRRYLYTRLHRITFQRAVSFIYTTVRTFHLT